MGVGCTLLTHFRFGKKTFKNAKQQHFLNQYFVFKSSQFQQHAQTFRSSVTGRILSSPVAARRVGGDSATTGRRLQGDAWPVGSSHQPAGLAGGMLGAQEKPKKTDLGNPFFFFFAP